MFPIVHMSFMGPGMSLATPPGMDGATLSDPSWREAYKQAALDVVRASRPLYLSLGNEVNRWYERYGNAADDPNGFQHYVSLYEEVYDAVKRLSPQTRVFCVFAREMVAESREADMDVLGMFPPEKMDLLVITSYPYAVQRINRPSDIPDDYYSRLLELVPGKPFGFSELGWPSLNAFGGQGAQADFIGQVVGRLTREQGVDLHMVGWAWLHDLEGGDAVGLIRRDGTAKLAYDAWRSVSLFGKWMTREQAIPRDAVKVIPETDLFPPVLHSDEWESPVPLGPPINTAGAEDSPFVTADGTAFYFFFTPGRDVPVNEQLLDGVTGVWRSARIGEGWSEPRKLILDDEPSLDGCPFVQGNTMWFCSARQGNFRGVDMYTADLEDGEWVNWKNAGERLNVDYLVGEMHLSADGTELYFHSDRPGGRGGYDIWVSRKVNGEWQEPQNVEAVNSAETDGWPFLTQDGRELWFTRWYRGYPAIFRSTRSDGGWGEPELIISQFAAEPTLDRMGNIYFVHHFFADGVMLEADIYVAYRLQP
jgi:hypothetical protein